ncbi:MAG: hypothetical protein ACC661_03055 [Verrucomicrobiales bacterium]
MKQLKPDFTAAIASIPGRLFRAALILALVGAGGILNTACETTHDPKDGPSESVSNIPWNKQQSWEGNPYGAFMPGSR